MDSARDVGAAGGTCIPEKPSYGFPLRSFELPYLFSLGLDDTNINAGIELNFEKQSVSTNQSINAVCVILKVPLSWSLTYSHPVYSSRTRHPDSESRLRSLKPNQSISDKDSRNGVIEAFIVVGEKEGISLT